MAKRREILEKEWSLKNKKTTSNYSLFLNLTGSNIPIGSKMFGGKEALKSCQERDKIKDRICSVKQVNLLRIHYKDIEDIENLLELWKGEKVLKLISQNF